MKSIFDPSYLSGPSQLHAPTSSTQKYDISVMPVLQNCLCPACTITESSTAKINLFLLTNAECFQ